MNSSIYLQLCNPEQTEPRLFRYSLLTPDERLARRRKYEDI
jgi:hypothetical protein